MRQPVKVRDQAFPSGLPPPILIVVVDDVPGAAASACLAGPAGLNTGVVRPILFNLCQSGPTVQGYKRRSFCARGAQRREGKGKVVENAAKSSGTTVVGTCWPPSSAYSGISDAILGPEGDSDSDSPRTRNFIASRCNVAASPANRVRGTDRDVGYVGYVRLDAQGLDPMSCK